jgi:predicted lipoprotein with Yx(FWY)xxD motif
MRRPMALIGVVLIAGVSACGGGSGHKSASPARPKPAAAVEVKTVQSSLGRILADQNGRTLYAFADDKGGGSSTCTGNCIATWPALTSVKPATVADGLDKSLLSTTQRAEGAAQSTYNSWPLYYYVGDVGPGDIDGQGVDGVWFVIGADGKLVRGTP